MQAIVKNFDPMMSAAKGKGCSASIAFGAPERIVKVFLGGVGVASVAPTNQPHLATLDALTQRGVTSMEWLSNRMVGSDEDLGEIQVTFKVLPGGKSRSTALLVPQASGRLLPALIVNTLYLDIAIPALKLNLENRQALLLTSSSVAMSKETLLQDQRVQAFSRGLPSYERGLLAGQAPSRFLAYGIHKQSDPAELFEKQKAFVPVGRLINSTVTVLPHYGVEVEVISSTLEPPNWTAKLKVSNLLNNELSLRWFADALNRIELGGVRKGQLRLKANKSKELSLKGKLLDRPDVMNALDTVMFSIFNVARGPEDFVSGYIALRVGDVKG